ncbi:CoA pyrophosphatase [Flavobacterium sp. ANB]|uniref:NUDIX hydrolase n=1 Tax=unclassified Flavobacterium TaxID=196869 RepID=UPI0012B7C24A|nr:MULTISPECIES: CoA pyrophosphatase [unclassified Flavobacterium]MBF4519027.1 CoA pyrophosphatase [Flavobacterium sp. ANB]MTD71629.1 NUDIX domain-containing protein [Flavobacterium sp. LC2016-13]
MKSFYSFIEYLTKNLQKPLPGEAAHQVIQNSSKTRLSFKPNEHTRRSAVLILFYPFKDEVYLPLILRPSYDGVHSAQVAFPGGKYEPADENLIQTALREANEEIGLKISDVKILGTLTELFIGPSNFKVLPVIGYLSYKPDFIGDKREVEKILETKLNDIYNPNIIGSSEMLIRGEQVTVPYYEIHNNKVWGATAKMISELLFVLDDGLSSKEN